MRRALAKRLPARTSKLWESGEPEGRSGSVEERTIKGLPPGVGVRHYVAGHTDGSTELKTLCGNWASIMPLPPGTLPRYCEVCRDKQTPIP